MVARSCSLIRQECGSRAVTRILANAATRRWNAATRRCLDLAFLLLLCGFLFFYRLGERSLSSSHEARAAQNAVSILRERAWALPHLLNGRVELQKPPLYYWLVALWAQGNGGEVDAWAVRMPAAISALACVLAL